MIKILRTQLLIGIFFIVFNIKAFGEPTCGFGGPTMYTSGFINFTVPSSNDTDKNICSESFFTPDYSDQVALIFIPEILSPPNNITDMSAYYQCGWFSNKYPLEQEQIAICLPGDSITITLTKGNLQGSISVDPPLLPDRATCFDTYQPNRENSTLTWGILPSGVNSQNCLKSFMPQVNSTIKFTPTLVIIPVDGSSFDAYYNCEGDTTNYSALQTQTYTCPKGKSITIGLNGTSATNTTSMNGVLSTSLDELPPSPPPTNSNNNVILIAGSVVVFFVAIVGGKWYCCYKQHKLKTNTQAPINIV